MRSKGLLRFLSVLLTVVMTINTFPTAAIAEALEEQRAVLAQVSAQSSEKTDEKTSAPPGDAAQGKTDATVTENPTAGQTAPAPSQEEPSLGAESQTPAQNEMLGESGLTQTPEEGTLGQEEVAQRQADREQAAKEQITSAAFEQSKTIENTTVTVKAPENTFPEGATLSVAKVPAQEQAKVDEAVGAERATTDKSQANVAVSYTFDIKVLDAAGKELQPAGGNKVEVSFALPQVADANLDIMVYHVEEQQNTDALTAQKLEATENEAEKKVTAKSDGFSYYTVEFTYGKLQYVLAGDESVPLADILRTINLTGEPQAVTTSNPELFSASKDTGRWVVTAHKAFDSQEWMKVTIADVAYQIEVTDAQGDDSTSQEADFTYRDANDQSVTSRFKKYNGETTIDGWYAVSKAGKTKVYGRITVKGDSHLLLCDDAILECGGITIEDGASLTIYAQTQQVTYGSKMTGQLKATSDKDNKAAISVNEGSSLTINGGEITAVTNTPDAAGIGGDKNKSAGTITINRGKVEARANKFGAGIGGGRSDDPFAGISGGTITINGGDVAAFGSYHAAGIGGGSNGFSGNIVIDTLDKVYAAGGEGGAGIGGGYLGTCNVLVKSGQISAIGGAGGAGIGSGEGMDVGAATGTISIEGARIEDATGGDGAAGIGTGRNAIASIKSIDILGDEIVANGGMNAAGIGCGSNSAISGDPVDMSINISRGSILAQGNCLGAGIGGGAGQAIRNITISGKDTAIVATGGFGAGIGTGGTKLGDKSAPIVRGGKITIIDSTVLAVSLGGGAGIGGGIFGTGGEITISGAKVSALGGSGYYNKKDKKIELFGGGQLQNYLTSAYTYALLGVRLSLLGLGDSVGNFVTKVENAVGNVVLWPVNFIKDKIFGSSNVVINYTGAGIGGGYGAGGGYINITNDAIVDAQAGRSEHDDEKDKPYPTANVTLESYAIGRGKHSRTEFNGDYSTGVDIYIDSKISLGYLVNSVTNDDKPIADKYERRDGRVTYGRYGSWATESVQEYQWVAIEPDRVYRFDLEKAWSEGANLPDDAEVAIYWEEDSSEASYDYVASNQYYLRKNDMHLGNWNTSRLGDGAPHAHGNKILYFIERTKEDLPDTSHRRYMFPEGYVPYKWELVSQDGTRIRLPEDRNHPGNAYRAMLDLRSVEKSGLSQNDYTAAVEAIQSGKAKVVVTNVGMKTYHVSVAWKGNTSRPSNVKAVLQQKETDSEGNETWKTIQTIDLPKDGKWEADFEPVLDIGDENYRIRELASDNTTVVYDRSDKVTGITDVLWNLFKWGTGNDTVDFDVAYNKGDGDNKSTTTITNDSNKRTVQIEKKWSVDLEKKDHPNSIEAIVQEKKNDKWETVEVVELNNDNDWKTSLKVLKTRDDSNDEIEYRVRELREETALQELMNKIKAPIEQGKEAYDEWINTLKTEGKTYWDGLPADIKSAADNGYDSLIDKLNATPENLYDKLMDKLSFSSAESRIVFDDDDKDKSGDANRVTYHVDAYTSSVEGQVEAHVTKYKVDYGHKGDEYSIENEAILDIDTIKRWVSLGVKDDDMPDSAWVVLMCSPKAGAKDKAGSIAGAAGVDLGGVLDYEFPVINPIEGGKNPVSVISQMALGIDLNIFNVFKSIPDLAIAKVDKGDNWTKQFVVKKYTAGIPMDFKGAELTSEIITLIIKYITGMNMPVSYNPFDNYVSIPTKAIRTIAGITSPSDLFDLKGLAGKAVQRAKSMTMADVQNFGVNTLLDDWHLMANVINLKIDWNRDSDNDDGDPKTIKGTKTWVDKKEASTDENGQPIDDLGYDHNADRPEKLKIHIKGKDNKDVGTVELNREDFKEGDGDEARYKDVWDWEFTLPDGVSKKDCTVTEEYPEGYAYKNDYLLSVDGFKLTNTWRDDVIYGQKTWKDGDNQDGLRPESITVHLYAQVEGGEPQEVAVKKQESEGDGQSSEPTYGMTVTAENGWRYFFQAPRTDTETGKPITYTIKETCADKEGTDEEPVPGYTTTYDGFNITNTHEVQQTKVDVTKVWDDTNNQDGKRPESVTIKLFADGEDTGKTLELNESTKDSNGNWIGSFEGLDANKVGKPITYSIEEAKTEVITGEDGPGTYDIEVSENTTGEQGGGSSGNDGGSGNDGNSMPTVSPKSFTITNKHTPEKTTVSGEKTWNDASNQDGKRPTSITIRLKAGEEELDSKNVTAAEGWNWTFADLPKYKDGQEINYAITEDAIETNRGYETEVNGYNVTNTRKPATVTVYGKKTWNDNDDEHHVRPESITVRLRANGKETASATVTPDDDGNWTWRFENLPKYEAGKEISYDVTEDAVENYTARADGGMDLDTGALERNITNDCTIGKTQVNVFKVWDDDGNRDNIRPGSVTVQLLANGEDTGEAQELSPETDWKASFKNLDAGKDYSVREVLDDVVTGVDGERTYAVGQVEGDAKQGFTITNKHTPKKTRVTVSKRWNDDDNRDNEREPVSLKLMANGEFFGSAMVGDLNDWTYTFEDLPALDNGKKITYTIREQDVAQWDMTVEGNASTGFTVTNKHNPERITVAGRKTWVDNNNELGKRPESVTVRLFANGREIENKRVTAGDNWSWEFGNLYKYEAGKEIVYTITEDAVANYTSEVDGYNVTNTYEPGKTQVNVTKAWDDQDDQDSRRPDKVTVHLLANDEDTGKILILNESGDWTGSFTDLDAKVDGKDVTYTVKEDGVDGYTSEVRGNTAEGFTITNKYQPETVSVSVRKAWKDGVPGIVQHSPVVVHLYANGKEVEGKTLTSANFWIWTREGLPKYENGHEITYTVSEDAIHDYTTAVSGNAKDGFVITNTNAPGKTSLSVRKVWDDRYDQDGRRPDSIRVRLLADGKDTGRSLVLDEDNGWSGVFGEIDDDPTVAYTVAEDRDGAWAEAYDEDPEITGDATTGYTIVNEYDPEYVNIDGTKVWDDNDNAAGKRPETITVRLLANGSEVDRGTIDRNSLEGSTDNEWKWNFAAKDKYENGREIAYTVTEDAVPDYATTYDKGEKSSRGYKNYTITNRYGEDTAGKTQVAVHQVWADANDQDGLRPKTAEVFLLANGEYTGKSLTLGRAEGQAANSDDDQAWYGVFEGLDAKDQYGSTIKYSVAKDRVPAYDTYYYGYAKRGFTIVDEHKPDTVTIKGTKEWDDQNNLDGSRPANVTVRLLADGKTIKTTEATASNKWQWEFADLPKMADGKEIEYGIYEAPVTGYDSKVERKEDGDYTITNTHVPGTTSVEGKKVWKDDDNRDGIRPNSITINLYANGKDNKVKTTEVTEVSKAEDGTWAWAFNNLPKTDAGEDIVYEIDEDEVAGYETTITGDVASGFVVTNSHTPGTTQVSVTKAWEGEGAHPDSVVMRLLADGADTGKSLTLSEANGWKGVFEGLFVKAGGKDIAYTVAEDAVEGYEASYSGDALTGFTITNKPKSEEQVTPPTPSDPSGKKGVITYQLNGGSYNGSTEDIVETYDVGTVISVHEAPTRDGYTFDYWKGSEYQPGDKYTVEGDHTFEAQWKETAGTTPTETPTPTNPSGPSTPSGSTVPTTTPTTTTRTSTPATGDESAQMLWLSIATAALGLIALGLRKRKNA